MIFFSICFLFVLQCGFCSQIGTGQKELIMEDFITKMNYTYENHTIPTRDGYLLTTGRLPFVANKSCAEKKGTVIIHHGLLNNGLVYFYMGPEHSFGFQLSDNCYDVWVMNVRGTKHSSRHVTLTTRDQSFWNFSLDELAKYDIRANIDYVLNVTGESKIHFIGYSQASTEMLMFLSTYPEYEKHVISLQLMAPMVYFENFTAYHPKLPKQLVYTLTKVASRIFSRPLPDRDYFFHELLSKLCHSSDGHQLCLAIIDGVKAGITEQRNERWVSNFPDRISMKMMAQYGQFYMSREFQKYDYGPEQNLLEYGAKSPPNYHYENIRVPIYLYYAEGDMYCTKLGVEKLVKRIYNLKSKHFIPDPNWGHGKFLTPGAETTEKLYRHIVKAMNEVPSA